MNGVDFEPSVDGITLVQRYIVAPDQTITRVEFIGRTFAYVARVDSSKGFELCPADVCALDASTCIADAEPRFAFEVIAGFGDSALDASLVPRMQAVMTNKGLDVAAFEFMLIADGTPHVYNNNTNTNYNSGSEVRTGVLAMGFPADHLSAELATVLRFGLKAAS